MFSSILFLIKSAAAFDDCLDSQRREKPLLRSLGIYKSLVARAGTKTKTKNKKQNKTKTTRHSAPRENQNCHLHISTTSALQSCFSRAYPQNVCDWHFKRQTYFLCHLVFPLFFGFMLIKQVSR